MEINALTPMAASAKFSFDVDSAYSGSRNYTNHISLYNIANYNHMHQYVIVLEVWNLMEVQNLIFYPLNNLIISSELFLI